MPGREPCDKIRVLRFGSFSGSGSSLLAALRHHVEVDDIDVGEYRRDLHVMKGRLYSLIEGVGGRVAPAVKTAAWSSHLQEVLARDGALESDVPTLFVQSLHAFDLPPGLQYAIYTDRVGREGAVVGGAYRSRFTRAWSRREAEFLLAAAAVFVMGPSTKTALTERYGLDPSRVSVVGAGPNAPVRARPESIRLKRILFVGTQWDLKGGPELLSAVSAARRVVGDLETLVVGSSPKGAAPVGVTFAGRLSDLEMSAAYSQSDALVVPTHMEAFGISILESLLHGIPCIGTTVGNQEWLIGRAGVIVPPGDPDTLAAALIKVAEEYSTYQIAAQMRGRALGEVMQWQLVADRIIAGLCRGELSADLELE